MEVQVTVNGKKVFSNQEVSNSSSIPLHSEEFGDYVIVRTNAAGVFAGFLKEKVSEQITLRKARRLWYWDGAASLSQLSVDGVSKPENCKFPCEVEKVILLDVIEVLFCTEKAKKSIENVKVWQA